MTRPRRSSVAAPRLASLLCVVALTISSPRVLGWNDGPPPAEEEYFGNRLRQHDMGQGLYEQAEEPRNGIAFARHIVAAIGGFIIERVWGGQSLKKLKKKQEADLSRLTADWSSKWGKIKAMKEQQLMAAKSNLVEAQTVLLELQRAAVDAGVDQSELTAGGAGAGGGGGRSQQELDYEEFMQPDTDKDNMISRAEFNKYIRTYLQEYPEVSPSDVPRFEDFDVNGNGLVSFAEWQRYLENNRQLEETYADSRYGTGGGGYVQKDAGRAYY